MDLIKELKKRFTDEQIARSTIHGRPVLEFAEHMKKKTGKTHWKSKTEAMYAFYLDYQKTTGEISKWEYEGLKFKIGDASEVEGGKRSGAYFTPDFLVVFPDGHMELHEIKGGGYCREAARVRFLAARKQWPEFTWRMITKQRRDWVETL